MKLSGDSIQAGGGYMVSCLCFSNVSRNMPAGRCDGWLGFQVSDGRGAPHVSYAVRDERVGDSLRHSMAAFWCYSETTWQKVETLDLQHAGTKRLKACRTLRSNLLKEACKTGLVRGSHNKQGLV